MEFKQLEAFVSVLRNKSFSKAAEELFLSQPTVSSYVSSLEKELNLQLIDRTYRNAEPTAEGRLLYRYALTLLNTRNQAVYDVQNFALNINGTVRICSSSVPGKLLVPGLMAQFYRQYNDVKFIYTQLDSQSVFDTILSHEYEIGFVGTKKNNGLVYKPVMKDRMVLITPRREEYAEAAENGLFLEDLKGESLIVREEGSGTRMEFEEALRDRGLSVGEMNIVAHINETGSIIKMVESGLGVAVISNAALDRRTQNPDYYVVRLNDYSRERTLYMVHDGRVTLSPTADTFRYFVEMKGGEKDV